MKALIVVVVLAMALSAQAEELTFSWTSGSEPQATGLNIYMNDWNTLVGDNLPDSGTATITADLGGNCKTFWATYRNETIESDRSAEARACANGATLSIPGGFTMTINVTPN